MDKLRTALRAKNDRKLKHLKSKNNIGVGAFKLPDELERYVGANVFEEKCKLAAEELRGPVIVENELGVKVCLCQD